MTIRTVVIAFLETHGWTKPYMWALRGDANEPKIKMIINIREKERVISVTGSVQGKCADRLMSHFQVYFIFLYVHLRYCMNMLRIKIKYGQKYTKFIVVRHQTVKARCPADLRF
jgi:hypothetical protein